MDAKDRRTKRQKLKDMANQSASPQEAEIAKKKLEGLKEEPVLKNGDALSFDFTIHYSEFGPDERVSGNPMDKAMDGVWILVGDKFIKL